ncbi:MAG: glycosyltransferase [Thermodesulfobacteriota bacterium]
MRRTKRKVYVVLPAYNEEARIGNLLDSIDEAMSEAMLSHEIVIVEDGSSDNTAVVVQERSEHMPIFMKQHEVNMGLGATIRDGLYAAVEKAGPRDIIITMDADDTHLPGLILRMVRMISEGHDVVIASRYQPGARTIGVPLFRRFLSYAASVLFRICYPTLGVKDFTCGYRAYRAEVLKEAISRYGDEFLNQDGFQCMVDILLKLSKMNVVFGEVPIILRYDFKEGESKMDITNTSRKTLRLLFKRRFGI